MSDDEDRSEPHHEEKVRPGIRVIQSDSAHPASRGLHSPLANALQIDRACARFENRWRTGQVPVLEALLDDVDATGSDRARLFGELLALELELRQQAGERPSIATYLERFPDYAELVAKIFAESSDEQGKETGRQGESAGSSRAVYPARRFGDYELLGELARGGMGVVYRARQVSLDRVVALKMILSGEFASESELRRFRAEAEAAAHLDHPNIVPIFEVGRHQGHAFFSMKLIGGGNLGRHLARYREDPQAVARLMATVARTVGHAHRKGMVHRDLKPSNILIDESGQPLIADFGLVKRTGDGSSLTSSGVLLGTPAYMAPEQVSGHEAAPAADIYSLGAILYQLLTGRPPFRAATVAETLAQVLEHDPVPPRSLRPAIPRGLEFICLKCLEKAPARRYQSALDLAADLERFLHGDEVHGGQLSLAHRLGRWARAEPEFACRIVGQSLILLLTQVNFLINPAPDVPIHLATTAVEILWVLSSWLLRRLARAEHRWELVRMAWIVLDVAMLTLLLRILGASDSSLVIGFPMLIAASGLWNRVRLVWLTTVVSMSGYSLMAFDAWLRDAPRDSNHHPDIILAGLAVTGLVVAQQVRRIRALTAAARPVEVPLEATETLLKAERT
jgi:serine/threonine-protein kinase